METFGVVDTMFARYDMGGAALDELESCPGFGETFTVIRQTVPGFKDLAVAAKNLIERQVTPEVKETLRGPCATVVG